MSGFYKMGTCNYGNSDVDVNAASGPPDFFKILELNALNSSCKRLVFLSLTKTAVPHTQKQCGLNQQYCFYPLRKC